MHIRTAYKFWMWLGMGTVLGLGWSTCARTTGDALQGINSMPSVAAVGAIAPDFSLIDTSGQIHRLSGYHGKRVLLCFFCGCTACTKFAPWCERLRRSFPQMSVLGITSMEMPDATRFRARVDAEFPVLMDLDSKVQERYQSAECPRCWVIDQQGVVAYSSRRGEDVSHLGNDLQKYLSHTES